MGGIFAGLMVSFIALFGTVWIFSTYFFLTRIIKIEHDDFHDQWEKDGCPHGMPFWFPPKEEFFSSLRSNPWWKGYPWLVKAPDWMKNHPAAMKMLRYYRVTSWIGFILSSALCVLAFVLAQSPKITARFYHFEAATYIYENEPDKAVESFSKAIESDPTMVDAYNDRGVTYDHLGNYEKALLDFNQVIQLNPKSSKAYYNRAVVFYELHKTDEALRNYAKASDAYAIRAASLGKLGRYPEAFADYEKALSLNPQNTGLYLNRGVDYAESGQLKLALQDLEKYLELNPNAPDRERIEGMIQQVKDDIAAHNLK